MATIDYQFAYVTNNNGTSLATINPKTNTFDDFGKFRDENDLDTQLDGIYGLAFGKDGKLYATQERPNPAIDTQLWEVILPAEKQGSDDIVKLKKIGDGVGKDKDGNYISTHAMDIGPDGKMYMLDLKGDIYTVDLTTGLATFVAATNGDEVLKNTMDIAFDNEGNLFAVASDNNTNPNSKRLYKVDQITGATTLIGSTTETTGTGATDHQLMGLWSDANGKLFGTSFQAPGVYYSINKKTGALTELSSATGTRPHGGDLWIAYAGWGDEASISISTSAGIQKPDASFVATADSVTEAVLAELKDSGIILNSQAIDFKVETGGKSPVVTANLALSSISEDLVLTGTDGKRDTAKKLGYVSIKDNGELDSLSWDPLVNAGARFFDTDGDGVADFMSATFVDGGTGDKDGEVNGVIVDPSTAATVELDPVITALESGFFKIGDPNSSTDLAAAALALKATLTKRSDTANQIGYVILNDGEDDTTVGEFSAFQERARILFSTLEADDVTLNDALTNLFDQQFLLRNNQSIRFFTVADATLDQLTSLSDSRFSFLDGSIDAATGIASFANASGIGFDLELFSADQGLDALIGNVQSVAPILDFNAFTNGETITGVLTQGREATMDSVTGFYRVIDSNGTVLDADGKALAPGAAGYAAAALLEANRVSSLDKLKLADGKTTSTEFSLQEAAYLAPFATTDEGNTFFAYAKANADGINHFRTLGGNLFGLEDQLGGGDLDFDDHIFGFSGFKLTAAEPEPVV